MSWSAYKFAINRRSLPGNCTWCAVQYGRFLPRDAMLSAVHAVVVYLSARLCVCLSVLIGCEIAKAEMTHFQRHCWLVSMPFTKEDKILIKNLFELKGYNARHLVKDFPRKS